MPTTVRWLVAQRKFELTVRAGRRSVEREIVWAHAIELSDPTPWIEPGDMVLTTGMNLSPDADQQRAYVLRLAEADVSALGFGTQVVHRDIPPTVIAVADEVGLPLVEIPLPTPFIALTRAIADQKSARRADVLRNVSQRMERMTRVVLSDGSAGLVRALATTLAATVVVLDAGDEIVAGSTSDPELVDHIRRELPARNGRPDSFSLGQQNAHGYLSAQSLGTTGALCVLGSNRFDWGEQLLINHTRSLIMLAGRQSEESVDIERALRAAALRLVTDRPDTESDFRNLSAKFGMTESDPVVGISLACVPDPLVTTTIERILATSRIPFLAENDDRDYTVLLQPGGHSVREFVDTLTAQLHALGLCHSSCGIGLPVAPTAAANTVRQARFVSRVAAAQRRPALAYEDLGVHTLLLAGHDRAELRTISDTVLGPLFEHDGRYPGKLVRSLDAFLRHNGQWEPAAADLDVHRHTLRNRIKRIEILTGRRLESAHDRSELLLALTANTILEWNAHTAPSE